nr:hypothetical protein [Tanacetum cinerariifolium]
MDQDRQMLMVEDNVGNQFRPNAVQNVGNQVVQNVVQNPSIQIVENMNGLSVVSEITKYGNGNVIPASAEGNGNGINGNPIRCYNCRGEGHHASNCTIKPKKRRSSSQDCYSFLVIYFFFIPFVHDLYLNHEFEDAHVVSPFIDFSNSDEELGDGDVINDIREERRNLEDFRPPKIKCL